jgi:hypothetical protein
MKISTNLRLATAPHHDSPQSTVSNDITVLDSLQRWEETSMDGSIVRGAAIANLAQVAACLIEIVALA